MLVSLEKCRLGVVEKDFLCNVFILVLLGESVDGSAAVWVRIYAIYQFLVNGDRHLQIYAETMSTAAEAVPSRGILHIYNCQPYFQYCRPS